MRNLFVVSLVLVASFPQYVLFIVTGNRMTTANFYSGDACKYAAK
jgi:hypothetical protein